MKRFTGFAAIAIALAVMHSSFAHAQEEKTPGAEENKRISVSGNIGMEGNYSSTDYKDNAAEDTDSSGFGASVELVLDLNVAKYVTGHAGFIWEDGTEGDALGLDEGFILLGGNDEMPLYIKAGKMYVPFGKYETNMISDPLTLDLGETRETAAEIGFSFAGFNASFYTFNGEVDLEGEDDKIDNFGGSLGYTFSNDSLSLEVGGGYINNIYDSNGLTDSMNEGIEEAEEIGFSVALSDYIPGMAAYAVFKAFNFTLIGEYVAMMDDTETDLADIIPGTLSSLGLGNKAKADGLKAWNIEAGYTFDIAGRESTVSAAYQGVSNAEEGFPEARYMGAVSVSIFENTTAGVEYAYDTYENDDKGSTVTAKIEMEF